MKVSPAKIIQISSAQDGHGNMNLYSLDSHGEVWELVPHDADTLNTPEHWRHVSTERREGETPSL